MYRAFDHNSSERIKEMQSSGVHCSTAHNEPLNTACHFMFLHLIMNISRDYTLLLMPFMDQHTPEYERIRRKRIAYNQARLGELGILELAAHIKKPQKPRQSRKSRVKGQQPSRASARLQAAKMAADADADLQLMIDSIRKAYPHWKAADLQDSAADHEERHARPLQEIQDRYAMTVQLIIDMCNC